MKPNYMTTRGSLTDRLWNVELWKDGSNIFAGRQQLDSCRWDVLTFQAWLTEN